MLWPKALSWPSSPWPSWRGMSLTPVRAPICLFLVLLVAACDSDDGTTGPPPPPPTGSVAVTIATTGVRIDPDGYELTVGPLTRSVGTNGVVQFSGLPAGTHAVALDGLALNCMETDPALASVTVQAGQTAQTTVDVECGYLVFVANHVSDDISVISTLTQSVVATIEPGGVSGGLAITPDGERLYFGNLGRPVLHRVDAVSTTTFEIVAEVPVTYGVFEIAISSDGAFGYAVAPNEGQVEVFDVAGNTVVGSIRVAAFSTDVALTGDGRRAYVAVHGAHRLWELDLDTNSRIRATAVDAPFAVALSSDESRVYVSRYGMEDVLALNRSDLGLRSQTSLGFRALDLQLSPDGRRLYAGGGQSIRVLDAGTLRPIASIPVSGMRMALTADGELLYATDTGADLVRAISTADHTVIAQIPVGDQPRGVVITPP